ncbi:hypothetical protein HYI36_17585 [Bacillus sp. Gen3]|nr:hypothetical protein [Bacillus sp. Gen3]
MLKRLIIPVFAVFALVGCSDETTKQAEENKNKTEIKETVDNKTETEKKEEPKKKPEVKKVTPTIDKVELSAENIMPLIKKKNKNVDKVEVTNGDVKIYFDPERTYWDETDIARLTAIEGLNLIEMVFKNNKTTSVQVIAPTKMVDSKGNETVQEVVKAKWNKQLNDEVNYKKFRDMVMAEFPRFYNESSTYYIHPGVFSNIKDKYLNAFEGGSQK